MEKYAVHIARKMYRIDMSEMLRCYRSKLFWLAKPVVFRKYILIIMNFFPLPAVPLIITLEFFKIID